MVASKQVRLAIEMEDERGTRLENNAATKWLRLVMEMEKKRRSKTGEDDSYHTGWPWKYRTKKTKQKFSRNELARPVIGTIFLV